MAGQTRPAPTRSTTLPRPVTEAIEVLHLRKAYGAGKTTTVECVIGLRSPDAGVIRVMGLDPQVDWAEPGSLPLLLPAPGGPPEDHVPIGTVASGPGRLGGGVRFLTVHFFRWE